MQFLPRSYNDEQYPAGPSDQAAAEPQQSFPAAPPPVEDDIPF
jgi:hypothetical protein